MIDDNEIDVYQVDRIVKKSGLVEQFYSFNNGQEALDHFIDPEKGEKKFNGYFPPKIILLDINMPIMDGFEFLDEYSKLPEEKQKSFIVIMLTSSNQQTDKVKASEFPLVKDFFVKPFKSEDLQKIIDIAQDS